jgi:hypothetical protein
LGWQGQVFSTFELLAHPFLSSLSLPHPRTLEIADAIRLGQKKQIKLPPSDTLKVKKSYGEILRQQKNSSPLIKSLILVPLV